MRLVPRERRGFSEPAESSRERGNLGTRMRCPGAGAQGGKGGSLALPLHSWAWPYTCGPSSSLLEPSLHTRPPRRDGVKGEQARAGPR